METEPDRVPGKVKAKMKKLMIAAVAALWGTVGFADVESANVVGYTTKAAGANLNWYAPQFFTVGANTTDINDIKLDDGGTGTVGWGDSMQIVGPLGNPSEMYFYWDPSSDPTGAATGYYWGDDAGNAVAVSFDAGDGIAIDNMNGLAFALNNAGDVPTEDVSFTASANLNWTGNPFPEAINLNAVTLDDGGAGTVGWGDSMQIVGPLGNPSEMYFYWDSSSDPTGTATGYYWGDDAGNAVDVTLKPGDGFAIDNMNGLTFDIKIACPYTK